MGNTEDTVPGNGTGRNSTALLSLLRTRIVSGEIEADTFLPTVRQLSEAHGVSRGTAWRALKALVAEGLVSAHPRHGYRVLARAGDPNLGTPIAYVLSQDNIIAGWDLYYRRLCAALEDAAKARGWKVMKVITTAGQESELIQQLTGARTWGLVLDSAIPELVEAARLSGFPVVMIEAWCPNAPFDAVVQDDFLGGRMAAEHLLGQSCRRIAWFGPVDDRNHGFPRYGGAAAALAGQGRGFSRTVPLNLQAPDLVAQARKLLKGRDRPDAVLALWRHAATALIRAAHELDLRIGKDLQMVGWCADEIYESTYVPMFAGAPVAPAVVWSTQEMVELALARLVERRERPQTPHTRMTVRTRLRLPA